MRTLAQQRARKKYDQSPKGKTHKKIINATYHDNKKQDPEYVEMRRVKSEVYNNKPEVKAHRVIINAIHRAKPEIKVQNAIYNSSWAKDNPDKVLANAQRVAKKLGGILNIPWTTISSQLKGWAKIIHTDGDQTCPVCGNPSEEAHHIFGKILHPELMFNRNNGIPFCKLCHRQAHGKMLEVQVV